MPEEVAHERGDVVRKIGLVNGAVHQLHPAIPCLLVNRERHMTHPQTRVTTLLDIAWGTAEASDEKVAQSLFGADQVVRRIHRTKDVVAWHLSVKRAHDPGKPVFTNPFVDLFFRQIHNSSMTDEAPKSAYELAMERLRRKDVESGIEERSVSEEQKAEIAEIRRVYAAKMAEIEILHKSKLLSVFEPEERALLEQGHRRDIERLRDEQERKLQKVRG